MGDEVHTTQGTELYIPDKEQRIRCKNSHLHTHIHARMHTHTFVHTSRIALEICFLNQVFHGAVTFTLTSPGVFDHGQ